MKWVCGFAVVGLSLTPPLFFPVGVRSWLGGASPPSVLFVFFGGGVACSSPCLPWAGARTGLHSVWLTVLLLELQFAAGRAPAPLVWWVMYTLGLAACPVGLGSGVADWAPSPAGFVRSWVKGGGAVRVPPPLRCRL